MKKYMSIVFVLMFGALCSPSLRATENGDQPQYPADNLKVPVAGPAQTNSAGVPKLIVEFQTAHAEIPPTFSTNLEAFGKYLKDNPASLAKIDGYADHTGHGPANAALAQKRANTVKEYLVTHCSVASSRITAAGYGEVSTKSRNDTEAGEQNNRSAVGTIVEVKS